MQNSKLVFFSIKKFNYLLGTSMYTRFLISGENIYTFMQKITKVRCKSDSQLSGQPQDETFATAALSNGSHATFAPDTSLCPPRAARIAREIVIAHHTKFTTNRRGDFAVCSTTILLPPFANLAATSLSANFH